MIEILVALAVARVSIFIVRERAPLAAMKRIRELFGSPNDDSGFPTPRNEIAHLLNCVWCVSFWVALVACYLADFPWWYSLPLSMVAIIVDEKL